MPRLNYPLKTYLKAVQLLAVRKGFKCVEYREGKKGSAIHFESFVGSETVPHEMWQVHYSHSKMKNITSMEDYKKAARKLNATIEEFKEILEEVN